MADKLMVSIADCDSFSASIVVFSNVSIVPFVWSKRDRQLVSYGPNASLHHPQTGFDRIIILRRTGAIELFWHRQYSIIYVPPYKLSATY